MSIVFRTLKGQALTYDEMDRNQSQFFYSASINANILHLHYTGSSTLNDGDVSYAPRFIEVPLGSGGGNQTILGGTGIEITNGDVANSIVINNTGTASPGNPTTSIQFNDGGSFGGDNLFVYDKTEDYVGIGITSGMERRLHIKGSSSTPAVVRLQSEGPQFSIGDQPTNTGQAFLEINEGTGSTVRIGKMDISSDDTHILQVNNKRKVHFSFQQTREITATVTKIGVGIGTQSPSRNLSIIGESDRGIGIGELDEGQLENRIRILPNGVWGKTFVDKDSNELEGINRYGLGIHTPLEGDEGGNMLIAVTDNEKGINEAEDPNRLLITGYDITGDDNTLDGVPIQIASFTAAGRVGIHTSDPNKDIRLDINGQYRGAYVTTNQASKLDFKTYSVIKFIPREGYEGPYYLENTIIPPEGTKAVLILGTNIVKYTVSFNNDQNLITGGDIGTNASRHSTITFVSDGTNLIETSRTVNMA